MLSWPNLVIPPLNLLNFRQWGNMYANDSYLDFTLQPYEADMAWLKETRPSSTEEELEAFADKCGHIHSENPDLSDEEIRKQSQEALRYL